MSVRGPKRSIASLSLGRAWVHALEPKLDAALAAGYQGIELFYEDLEYVAKELPGGLTDANRLAAAETIRGWCEGCGLEIIVLQPFMHYEGLIDRKRHDERVDEFKHWLELAGVLGTDLIAIPSTFLSESECTGDFDVLVSDLREVSDLAAEKGVKVCYEALCWGTHVNTWGQSYDLVKAVDRDNFGICLDTYNICGREYADPAAENGRIPDAEEVISKSIERMRTDLDPSKIFLVQAADAELMRTPLTPSHPFHVDGQPPRMSWSRNARLFPGETSRGAYLPALEVMRAVTGKDGLGYDGWVSFEVFTRTLAEEGEKVPMEHAQRGRESWEWMDRELGWSK
jgi:4-hydroxyphenylpyruvate dioxygenase